MLTGSDQKVRSRLPHIDWGHTNFMTAGAETGDNSFMSSERNTVNPSFRLTEAGSSQDGLLECLATDTGERKGRSIMERIGVVTSLRRANGQTSSWSCVTRELAKPS